MKAENTWCYFLMAVKGRDCSCLEMYGGMLISYFHLAISHSQQVM